MTTTVVLENPNLDAAVVDFESVTEYKDLPRKYVCLGEEENDGTHAQAPCQEGCGELPFTYLTEAGLTIPLQFRIPDYVNTDPANPTLGWMEDDPDAWWLALQVLSPDGDVLWEGPTAEVADSYSVFMSEGGPVQNLLINVDRLLAQLPAGTQCFYFRVLVKQALIEYGVVLDIGDWDGDPPPMAVGTVVINTDAANFGLYEYTTGGWVFLGLPVDGAVYFVQNTASWWQYSEASVIYTAHGADGAGNFSFSKGSITGAFTETDTEPVNTGGGTAPDGGLVLGMRIAPDDSDKVVAVQRRVRRWNGVQTNDNAEEGHSDTQNSTAWTVVNGDDSGPYLIDDSRNTRVAWGDDAGGAWTVRQGYVSNSVDPALYKSNDYGATWSSVDFDGTATGQEAASVAAYAYGGNVVVGMKSGRVYASDDGGATWEWYVLSGMSGSTVVARLNGDVVIAVGQFSGNFSLSPSKGFDDGSPGAGWGAVQNFPSLGYAWRATDILHDGDTCWIFGVNSGSTHGILWRSTDNGNSWDYLPSGEVLGGRASWMGRNTLICTSLIFGEAGSTPVRDGIVYISRDNGDTWAVLDNQPSGGAEALDGRLLPGTWDEIEAPGPVEPGEEVPTESVTTMSFRLRKCNEDAVKFTSTESGVDCLGFIHDAPGDEAHGNNPQAFQHSFLLKGSVEVDEYPIQRELTKNRRLLKVALSTKARLRCAGMPRAVARLVQTVLGTRNFNVNDEAWDQAESVKRNNDEGRMWWLDTVLTRQDCEQGSTCD